MSFFLKIYIFFYSINLISLYYLLGKTFGGKLSTYPLPQMVSYILNLSKLKDLYLGLVMALTGLPPFILFSLKFNYLIGSYSHLGFGIFYVVFLVLLVNMFYYLQGLIIKNIEVEIPAVKVQKKPIKFAYVFFMILNLAFSFLSIFYLPDVILVSSLVV